MPPNLTERQIDISPAQPDDGMFLRQLYAAGRAVELAATGWSAAQKQAFCDMQFDARERHYIRAFPSAFSGVVREKGVPVGRLYVDFADAVHLIDIALIPEIRGKGLGTQLLNWLIGFARSGDRLLTLEVAFDNPAQRLYERLGFVVTRQGFPYSSMLCR